MKRSRNRRGSALAGMLSLTGADSKHVRTIEVEDAPIETAQSFRKAYEEQERQKEAAKQKAANAVLAQKLFAEPSVELASRIPLFDAAGRTQQQVLTAAQAAVAGMKSTLESRGIVLSDSGLKKLAHITMLAGNNALDFAQANSWVILFEYADSLGAFDSSEVIRLADEQEQPAQSVQPQAQTDFDSMDNQSAKDAVLESVQADCKSWFQSWEATILRDFGVSFTDAQTAAIVKFLERGMVNYRSSSGWHTVRRACVAAGTLPSTLMYPAEVFDQQIESSDLDTFEQKQAYAREFHKLRELPNAGAPPTFYPSY